VFAKPQEKEVIAAARASCEARIDGWCTAFRESLPQDSDAWADNVQPIPDEVKGDVVAMYQKFAVLQVASTPLLIKATWVQVATAIFQWLHSINSPHAMLPARWSADALQSYRAADLKGPQYCGVYADKMAFWGQYLCAQFCVSGNFDMEAMTTMQTEIVDLRHQFAYSIPSNAALKAIKGLGLPLVESGAATGYWARLLKEEGCDIVAYDVPQWDPRYNPHEQAEAGSPTLRSDVLFPEVKMGGPDMLTGHADRALVLMWPDYGGRGTFARECLKNYKGSTLVCVGEWDGHTFGSIRPDFEIKGQSFSEGFQADVEKDFILEDTVPLPTWPTAADAVLIFRRRVE